MVALICFLSFLFGISLFVGILSGGGIMVVSVTFLFLLLGVGLVISDLLEEGKRLFLDIKIATFLWKADDIIIFYEYQDDLTEKIYKINYSNENKIKFMFVGLVYPGIAIVMEKKNKKMHYIDMRYGKTNYFNETLEDRIVQRKQEKYLSRL